jgi:NAD(P)-dependent dehydrogenase (short-subunit alcohol dehydrogenase family)
LDIRDIPAIVTGGASGLGAATAARLARKGAKVTIFDLNVQQGEKAAAEIGARFIAVNVADDESVATAIAQAKAAHGIARILVNCAGIGTPQKTVGKEAQPHVLADFRKTVEVNLFGSFNVLSKFAARLSTAEPIGEERGVIVNTASVAAYDGQIGQAAYSASKGGIVGMTLPVARDLSQFGIRVMTIAPGIFMTPLLAALPQPALDSQGRQVPFPSRLGLPEEYAQMVEAVIRNPMLNGETIRLDGAIRMGPR